MSGIFRGLNTLLLLTVGSGTLYTINYDNVAGLGNALESKTILASNQTRWVLGFCFNYAKYAFIWDGDEQATYRVGSRSSGLVGSNWNNASLVTWGDTDVTFGDVSSLATGPWGIDTLAWIVPPPF